MFESSHNPSTVSEQDLTGLRILVLEDSYLAAAAVAHALSTMGCQIVGPVSTIDEALELIERNECDAGVLDINLAGLSSEPVARAMRERNLPFLFITGYASPLLLSEAYRVFRRVRKPIEEVVLRSAMIDEFLRR